MVAKALQHNYTLTSWFAYGMGIAVGALYSVPSVLLLCLATYNIKKYFPEQISAKVLLTFSGILLTLLATSLCFSGLPDANEEIFFTEVYASVIVAAVWFYRLKPEAQQTAISFD